MDSSVSRERRNLVSARVPSYFNWPLPISDCGPEHILTRGFVVCRFSAGEFEGPALRLGLDLLLASFHIHCLFVIPPFDIVQPEILIASRNN